LASSPRWPHWDACGNAPVTDTHAPSAFAMGISARAGGRSRARPR
jgi:hypothetical protein